MYWLPTPPLLNLQEMASSTKTFLFLPRNSWVENPAILSLSWMPKVTHEQRQTHVDRLRQQGFSSFQIRDRSSGEMSLSGERNVYFPVTYITPYTGNENAHGHDIFAPDMIDNGARQIALNKARDNGQAMSTGRVSLVQREEKYGLVFYQPVYSENISNDSVTSRQEKLIGYTSGAFLISTMLAPINRGAELADMHMIVNDLDAKQQQTLLFDSRTADYKEARQSIPVDISSLQERVVIDVLGRQWEFLFIQKSPIVDKDQTRSLLLLLIGGLILSAGFSAFLLTMSAHRETLNNIIEDDNSEEIKMPVLIASVASIVVLISNFLISYKFEEQYHQSKKETLREQISLIAKEITSNVYSSAKALNRLAVRWENRQGIPLEEWNTDAHQLVNDLDALTKIEWIDSSYHVKRLAPLSGNESALGPRR